MTIEQSIRNVIASFEMEGFEIDDNTREMLRKVANKEATPEELIKEIKSKYESKGGQNNA